ncbi:MAG TPA: type II secretion system protein [Candidatus Paceibacterota bacterium]
MILKNNRGFSLIEMLIYLTVLTLFSVLVVGLIVAMMTSYRKLVLARTIADSAIVSMERMSREIRTATDVDLSGSQFDVSPGYIRLNTTDDNGLLQTISFKLESGRINVYKNDVLVGPLTPYRATTTVLVFRRYVGSRSKAVGIEMAVEAEHGNDVRSELFQTTILLRNSL